MTRWSDGCSRRSAPWWSALWLAALPALVGCGHKSEGPEQAAGEVRHPEMLADFQPISLAHTPPSKVEDHPDLKVKTLDEGNGEAIQYGQIGRFHVIASLPSGKTFENTYEGEPKVMRLLPPAVPEGLALGVADMKEGGRRQVIVPPELGYGHAGEPRQSVPPDAMLIYDVELVAVVHDLKVGVLTEGRGEELRYGDTGRFLYTGVLASNGTQFDATNPNDPRPFPITRGGGRSVPEGWVLGLPGMKEGEKRRLRVPAEFAYGEHGQPPLIPANADLIFDVELVGINH